MTGWECPKCRRCYAPSIAMCAYCGEGTTITVSGTGPSVCPGCGQERSAPALTGCPVGSHYGSIYTSPHHLDPTPGTVS